MIQKRLDYKQYILILINFFGNLLGFYIIYGCPTKQYIILIMYAYSPIDL
jgi:hypothetical protein